MVGCTPRVNGYSPGKPSLSTYREPSGAFCGPNTGGSATPLEVWNAARRGGQTALAKDLKGARFALWKNPQNLTARQQTKLADIQRINARLYRAYLLKEELRLVFQLRGAEGMAMLRHWLTWAQRCRIPAFVKLAASIKAHRAGIEATLTHELSNARVEAVNNKRRLLMRIAFGFRSAEALIGLAMLSLGGLCPSLPGRS